MKTLYTITCLFLMNAPVVVFAAANPLNELQKIGEDVYGTKVPRPLTDTIGSVVQALLGFVGIIFIVLIIWGGVQWMTSGGNDKKIEEAKKRILHATIGLVVIILAYAIARFIVTGLCVASGGVPSDFTGPLLPNQTRC